MRNKSLILPVLATFALVMVSASAIGAELYGKVVKITDGDTVTVLDEMDKAQFRIRVADIDAPEKKQAFGNRAKEMMGDLVFGKRVRVWFKDIDHYGRIVGRVYVDGEDAGLQLVQSGLAWHYKEYSDDPSYAEAEEKARARKLGLWRDRDPMPPWEFRKAGKK